MKHKLAKYISILLTITFLAGQSYAGQLIDNIPAQKGTLATSLVTDDINKARTAQVAERIGEVKEPGAIANGEPLAELAQGRIPPQAILTEEREKELAGKIQESIDMAISLATTALREGKIPRRHASITEDTAYALVAFRNHFSKMRYLFNADIRGPASYILGFNRENPKTGLPSIGLSVELVDMLSPRLLAQYVLHECAPERDITLTIIKDDARDAHRTLYTEVQTAIFGKEDVEKLREELRNLINFRLPPEKRVVMLISGGESAGVNNYFALMAKRLAAHGYALEAIRFGLDGLVKDGEGFEKTRVRVSPVMADEIMDMPGAFEGTARVNLERDVEAKEGKEAKKGNIDQVLNNIKGRFGTVIVIGGNDHTKQAAMLAEECKARGLDIAVLSLPKTIDYDTITYPVGARTAGENAHDMVMRAAALPGSKRISVIQCMGRDMGYLTVAAADMVNNLSNYSPEEQARMRQIAPTVVIATPEWSWNPLKERRVNLAALLQRVRETFEKYGAVTLAVSEGFRISEEDLKPICEMDHYLGYKLRTVGMKKDKHGNPLLTELGIGDFVARAIEAMPMAYGGEEVSFERDVNLLLEDTGYSIRATPPNDVDRAVAAQATDYATDLIVNNRAYVITSGGFQISADRSSRTVEDIRGTMRAKPFEHAVGTVDLERVVDTGKEEKGPREKTSIYREDELDNLSIIGRHLPPLTAVPEIPGQEALSQRPGMNVALAIRSLNSQSESGRDMKRPNICVIARDDADGFIALLKERAPIDKADAYVMARTRKALLPFLSTRERPVPLSEVVAQAYRTFKANNTVSVVVSSNFLVHKDDPVLKALADKDALLGSLITSFAPDKDGFIRFGRRMVDIIYLALTLLPPEGEKKAMSGVRKNILGESLNLLPGENSIEIAPPASASATLPAREARSSLGSTQAMGPAGEKARIIEEITKDMPVRAQEFAATLSGILTENPDKLHILGIDSDIGGFEQKGLLQQTIFDAVDRIAGLKNDRGEKLFPNLLVMRAMGRNLAADISALKKDGKVELGNVFVVAKKANLEADVFSAIRVDGGAWITAIDDSSARAYLPIFEAATLTLMAASGADTDAIRTFYDKVSENPIDPTVLQEMLRTRVIHLLPKATRLETKELRDLYEMAQQVHMAA
ncbi:MAG: 6-phosphofructokinase [Candidatus Omnitrophota bacterium]